MMINKITRSVGLKYWLKRFDTSFTAILLSEKLYTKISTYSDRQTARQTDRRPDRQTENDLIFNV